MDFYSGEYIGHEKSIEAAMRRFNINDAFRDALDMAYRSGYRDCDTQYRALQKAIIEKQANQETKNEN